MSRLDEEFILAIVRNRSGYGAGEIDYSMHMERFDRMSVGCLQDTLKTLEVLKDRCLDRIMQLERKEILEK